MRLAMPSIETNRLFLRPMEEGDVCDMYEYYKDASVTKFLTFPPHTDVNQTLSTLHTHFLSYERQGVPQAWVIVWKEEEKVIGNLNIHSVEDDIGQIGYVLHSTYWNKGIMKEALQELVRVAFGRIKLRRLEAYYAIEHEVSGKLLASCGFRREGVLRQYARLSDGRYHDMVMMSILKDDAVFQ